MIDLEKSEEVAVRLISKLAHLIMEMQEDGGEVPESPVLDEDEAAIVVGAVGLFPFSEDAK